MDRVPTASIKIICLKTVQRIKIIAVIAKYLTCSLFEVLRGRNGHYVICSLEDFTVRVETKLEIGEPSYLSLFNNSILFSLGNSHLLHHLSPHVVYDGCNTLNFRDGHNTQMFSDRASYPLGQRDWFWGGDLTKITPMRSLINLNELFLVLDCGAQE